MCSDIYGSQRIIDFNLLTFGALYLIDFYGLFNLISRKSIFKTFQIVKLQFNNFSLSNCIESSIINHRVTSILKVRLKE
mgnify:CR=1 FL=1